MLPLVSEEMQMLAEDVSVLTRVPEPGMPRLFIPVFQYELKEP